MVDYVAGMYELYKEEERRVQSKESVCPSGQSQWTLFFITLQANLMAQGQGSVISFLTNQAT